MAKEFRIGQGIDVHPFQEGRACILGGATIPYQKGLSGHSDADALLHAITDALLGATGRSDIGTYFPNDDPKWKNANSKDLLTQIWNEVKADGWCIVNLDCSILAEAPKLKPYISEMKNNICAVFEITSEQCAVKATTAERMGFIGRGEGIMAFCVMLVERD